MRSLVSPSLLLIVKVPESPETLSNDLNPKTTPQTSSSSTLAVECPAPRTQSLS